MLEQREDEKKPARKQKLMDEKKEKRLADAEAGTPTRPKRKDPKTSPKTTKKMARMTKLVEALVLGCSKCRYFVNGCGQCKDPKFKGKRGALAVMKKPAARKTPAA